MKHLKLFFALFAMLALGVGNAWGAEVTMTAGTNGSACTVNGINGIKVGTSKAGGDMTITVPAGATSLQLYAAAWKGVNGLSINITPESNVNPTSISLTADDGITSNSPFTLKGNAESFKYEVTLSNITAATTLTLKSSTTKRFVVWGATCTVAEGENPGEGGGEDPNPDPEEPGTGTSGEVTFVFDTDQGLSELGIAKPNAGAGTNLGSNVYTKAPINMTATDGSTATRVWNSSGATTLRVYKSTGSLTFSSEATINKIVFNTSITATASVGTLSGTTWTGEAKEVKFTFTANATIKTITVAYTAPSSGSGSGETVPSLTQEQFSWSATTATATLPNTFENQPTLTNTESLDVTYSSSNEDVAKIDASGNVTLRGVGTADIKATAGDDITFKKTTVYYTLTVNKAPATPTDNVYVKVTTTAGITDGEYLIVYEDATNTTPAPVAFNGALATDKLDVASNYIEVSIASNTIAGNTDIDAAIFTIDATAGTIQTKDGYYIGQTSDANGLLTNTSTQYTNTITIDTDGSVSIKSSGNAYLRYNAAKDNWRFRYFKSTTYTAQKAIALYKKVDPSEILAPAFSVAAGSYYDAQSVEITCATAGVEIYYTLDGSTPSSTSTKYTSAVAISETKTLKAIAIKGEYSSSVTEATYTILAPLATMQEIFDKATDATQSVHIKFNEWVISGVVPGKDGKPSSNAYITDGSKGFIIYTKDGHGFNVGNKLSGTVVCDLTRYNGSAEVVGLTSSTEGLTVTADGDVTPVEVADKSTLSGVNTGAVIKITGVCETKNVNSNDYFYVGGIQLFNSLFAYDTPTVGGKYNVTGVYLQYNDIPEILPRSADDIEEINDLTTATISIADITMEVGETKTIEATITPDAAQSTVQYAITAGNEYITLNGTTITAVAAGTATITATIAEVAGEYYGATKTFNVTVKSQNIAELPFEFTGVRADIENTLGMSQYGLGTDYTTAGVTTNLKFDGTGDWVIIHFNGQADKLAYDIKGNGFSGGKFTVQQSSDGSTYTEVVTYTELGDAATKEHVLAAESRYVKFIYTEKSSGNVGLGNIKITKFGEEPEQPGEGGGEGTEQPLTDWVLTSAADITINDLVVITMTKLETTWAMTNNNGTNAAPVASKVTVTANALAAEPDENLKWVVSNNNGTLTIYPY